MDEKSSKKKQRSSKRSRSRSPPSSSTSNNKNNNSSSSADSLSIEETNKLRAKLGLKPLSLGNEDTSSAKRAATSESSSSSKLSENKKYIDEKTSQEFEHMPAKNLADLKQQKEFKKKLDEQREKRRLMEKVKTSIADDDAEELSADVWVQKLRQKQEAAKKARLLEEMDQLAEEQGKEEEKEEGLRRKRGQQQQQQQYTANNLKGMRIEHDELMFREEQEVILTLKDRRILKGAGDELEVDDDEDADVLVNVNLLDDERMAKNVDNRKRRGADYKPYDDGFDEEGNFRERSILEKYNEELDGEKKKSFRLGARGTYDASDAKFLEKLNEEHRARAVKLELHELSLAKDYFTQQEMESFKKPKKLRKVMRGGGGCSSSSSNKSGKSLKPDDLLPLPSMSDSAKASAAVEIKKEKIEQTSTKAAAGGKISLKDIASDLQRGDRDQQEADKSSEAEKVGEEEEEDDDDDEIDLDRVRHNEEYQKIIDDENNALDELHTLLNKTRQKVIRTKTVDEQLAAGTALKEQEMAGAVVTLDNLATVKENADEDEQEEETVSGVVLDSLGEFCKNVGGRDRWSRGKGTIYDDEDDDDEEEEKKNSKMDQDKSNEVESDYTDEEEADEEEEMEAERTIGHATSAHQAEDDEDNEGMLNEEPVLDRGLGSALALAVSKGYLMKEKEKQNARLLKSSNIALQAKNYAVEEKNYYDIDAKYDRNNRDRFSGPLSDFSEKKGYKPSVKLDYIDEQGKSMNEKEAFRYLSHKFHGKGSGKKKTEKRIRKEAESQLMKKMSSGDTPLNTVSLLIEKQKRMQQPYVVLSAPKGKNDQ